MHLMYLSERQEKERKASVPTKSGHWWILPGIKCHYVKLAALEENLPYYVDWGKQSSTAGTISTHSQSTLASHLGTATEPSLLQNNPPMVRSDSTNKARLPFQQWHSNHLWLWQGQPQWHGWGWIQDEIYQTIRYCPQFLSLALPPLSLGACWKPAGKTAFPLLVMLRGIPAWGEMAAGMVITPIPEAAFQNFWAVELLRVVLPLPRWNACVCICFSLIPFSSMPLQCISATFVFCCLLWI